MAANPQNKTTEQTTNLRQITILELTEGFHS